MNYKLIKIFFWLDVVKNGCDQSGPWTLKLIVSQEWTDGITDILHVDTDSQKLKADQKIFGWAWSRNGCEQSGHGILKLNVSQKWTDRINWFFACWYKFRKAESWFNNSWVGMVKNNHDLLVHETRKSTIF